MSAPVLQTFVHHVLRHSQREEELVDSLAKNNIPVKSTAVREFINIRLECV